MRKDHVGTWREWGLHAGESSPWTHCSPVGTGPHTERLLETPDPLHAAVTTC